MRERRVVSSDLRHFLLSYVIRLLDVHASQESTHSGINPGVGVATPDFVLGSRRVEGSRGGREILSSIKRLNFSHEKRLISA